MGRKNDKYFAAIACFLIGFIGVTSQVFVFWPWLLYGNRSPFADSMVSEDEFGQPTGHGGGGLFALIADSLNVQAILYLVPFNFCIFMLCWNYHLTRITDPGAVPLDWMPPIDGDGQEFKKTTHTLRYCRTCDAYKPPRTHHCRSCKRCVLKMDHHCPWVNCIGHFNYGHFVRFIIWTSITTFYCLVLLATRVYEAMVNDALGVQLDRAPTTQQTIFIILNLCLGGGVFVGVSILSIYHMWCISSNTTTIESWEKDRVLTILRKGKIVDIKCPYHLGIISNFQAILGDNPLLWLWPQPMRGNGLVFRLSGQDHDEFIHMSEPHSPVGSYSSKSSTCSDTSTSSSTSSSTYSSPATHHRAMDHMHEMA